MTRRLITLLAALALALPAAAQTLAELLPAETFIAIGTQDLISHDDKLADFIDAFERYGVGDALVAAFGDSMANSDSGMPDDVTLPPALQGLGPMDFIGRETWLAVSASNFNPLPAVTILTRTSPNATAAFAQLIADARDDAGVLELTESGITFYQQEIEGDDGLGGVIAYAQSGDLLAASTNPDALRGVLRRLTGSNDPGFAANANYQGTLGALAAGNFSTYFDLAGLARIAQPFASGFGFDQLVSRLTAALDTAGATANVIRLTDRGLTSESLQLLNGAGSDLALYNLITNDFPASRAILSFAPATALSVIASRTDLAGWWNYLNDLVASAPELGIGDLDQAFSMFLNIDPRSVFFNWAGTQIGSITTGLGEIVQPGAPSSNFLGEVVYLIETTSEADATTGLNTLFGNLSGLVASFADPSGGMGSASQQLRDVAGVTVTSFDIIPGVTIAYAVTDGFALIATSNAAIDAVLKARQTGAGLQPALANLQPLIPSDATSYSLTDNRATLEGTAQQITSQLQLAAGLGGAGNLDFDAVTQASTAVEQFLGFVASRLGGSVNYRQARQGSVYGFGQTEVSW